eukprot:scaffold7396_cov387-Prasinococcus_capsulatus_cf.AAC.1
MYVFILGKWRRATATLSENGFGADEEDDDSSDAQKSSQGSSTTGDGGGTVVSAATQVSIHAQQSSCAIHWLSRKLMLLAVARAFPSCKLSRQR